MVKVIIGIDFVTCAFDSGWANSFSIDISKFGRKVLYPAQSK